MSGIPYTIESLQYDIEKWKQNSILNLEAANQLEKRFLDLVKKLRTEDCKFCRGIMVDTGPLEELTKELPNGFFRQGELFCLHCISCKTFPSSEPREKATVWERADLQNLSKQSLAFKMFSEYPSIEIVSYSQRSRWKFLYENRWFANLCYRDQVLKLLHLS